MPQSYSYIKRELTELGAPGVAPILLGGMAAGITTAIATNPIWVIKTRMQTQVLTSSDKSTHYRGIFGTSMKLKRSDCRSTFCSIFTALQILDLT